ncbi:hypothetical protein PISMIDRAFT_676948 [Pisolithus microcarpus 441]|uniref:Uncharacterized protein n=1 Tax=Pisolithus microcarpus 441 TaxID=765257 RepID=A0A0C9ZI36_9AGAM|nr:hypothetical protein PISMIDRAFT_676948 [Pisolithus microcarpus 441]
MTNVPHNSPFCHTLPVTRHNAAQDAQAGDAVPLNANTLHHSCTGQSSRQNCPNTHSGPKIIVS